MHIILSPVRRDETLSLERQGDCLIVNGETFDFSSLAEGGALSADTLGCSWILGHARRVNGELQLKILLPHGVNAPYQTLFATDVEVTENGPIPLPPHSIELPQEDNQEA